MKLSRPPSQLLVLCPLAAVVGAVLAWSPVRSPRMVPSALPVPSTWAAAPNPDTLRELADRAWARNPFRLDRRPSGVPFDPSGAYPPPPPPPPAKPTLELAGVVSGAVPAVIVEGLPGREDGVVLKLGEAFAGVTFDRLHGDSAVLRGLDTAWVLGPRGGRP
ncbi:MAG: hypothetical protein MJB57_07620 [Gemmatimonadetes bacterium]|nr:hypothetical protein [Gemmatimonadota bacterium]